MSSRECTIKQQAGEPFIDIRTQIESGSIEFRFEDKGHLYTLYKARNEYVHILHAPDIVAMALCFLYMANPMVIQPEYPEYSHSVL